MLFPFATGNMTEHVNVISSSVYPVHDVDRLVPEPLFIPSAVLPDSITTLVGGVLVYEIIAVTAKKDFAGITTEIPVLVNDVLSGKEICSDISTGILELTELAFMQNLVTRKQYVVRYTRTERSKL